MRTSSHRGAILALSIFFSSGSALPFLHLLNRSPLVARASYSVVPVDGGSGAAATAAASAGTTTIIQTTTASAAPITIVQVSVETSIQTSTVSPTAQTVVSISTVTDDEPASTVSVTVAPTPVVVSEAPAVTVTETDVVISQTSTTTIPLVTSTSVTSTSTGDSSITLSTSTSTSTASTTSRTLAPVLPSITTTPETYPVSVSSIPKPFIPITSASFSEGFYMSSFTTIITSTQEPLPDYTPALTSSSSFPATITPSPSPTSTTTKSYDNGMWHTTYPAWNSTLARRSPAPLVAAPAATNLVEHASSLSELGSAILEAARGAIAPEMRR